MYYCSSDLDSFHGDRIESMVDFLISGWGCVRKKDLMSLFNITRLQLASALRYIKTRQLNYVEKDDYMYIEFYDRYVAPSKYMNVLSVFASLAKKNKDKNITITDNVYSSMFIAKMYIDDPKSDEMRTYYALDTALVSLPFYALEDVIKSELSNNGFGLENKVIIIVYEDTKVEYIDIKSQVYYALQVKDGDSCYFEFYDNAQLKG